MKTYRKFLIALLMAICAISCAFAVACINTEEPPEPELQTLATPQNLQVVYNLKADNTIVYELVWDEVENASGYEVKISDNKIDAYQAKLDISKYVTAGRTYAIRVTAKGDEKNYTDSEMAVLSNKIEELTKGVEYSLLDDGTYKASAVNASISAITGRVVLADTYKGRIVSTLAEDCFNRTPLLINGATMKYNEYTTSVRLPAGLKVVEDYAFYGCKKIEEVVLPQTVTFIGSGAFSTCEALTTINMPQNLVEIGSSCFVNCTSLKNIELPEGIKIIGNSAFYGCELVNITTIPQSVESIGFNSFKGTIYYNDENNWENGALYLDNCLLDVNTDISGTFNIKEGTRIIAINTFNECSKLTEVIIPISIKKLDDSTFYSCISLIEIIIPENVTAIGTSVFESCGSLVEVIIPESVTSIGEFAFFNCSSLNRVTISNKVTILENATFFMCQSLTEITLSKNITKICENVFSYCSSLATINFDGTMEQWLAITKGNGWHTGTGDFTVICTDGKLDKLGNIRS